MHRFVKCLFRDMLTNFYWNWFIFDRYFFCWDTVYIKLEVPHCIWYVIVTVQLSGPYNKNMHKWKYSQKTCHRQKQHGQLQRRQLRIIRLGRVAFKTQQLKHVLSTDQWSYLTLTENTQGAMNTEQVRGRVQHPNQHMVRHKVDKFLQAVDCTIYQQLTDDANEGCFPNFERKLQTFVEPSWCDSVHKHWLSDPQQNYFSVTEKWMI